MDSDSHNSRETGQVMGTSSAESVQISEREMESYHSFMEAGLELESTLQKTTIPMALKEVNEYLEKQIAYLSGGRGEESSVIITLPECSSFSEIPEEALAKVLMYLTLTPRKRQPGVKFIIILDRRLDTWMSIKTALARIAASFPGNLHLVLVLRPTSFFQRTVTDIGFRFSQEDFMHKMPVVMLSSVTDLLHYIDENQLTQDLGGTLEYCHSDWILLRSGIESFAVTVKEIAQMLQAFGTELAETELPKEVTATEFLLMSHTAKYRQLKEDIRTVMRKGRQLLSSLEASGTVEAASEQKRDASQDWETVQRLLAQLHDMETAFDGFFEKHHLKLQQYLQLCRFERSFREMELSLQQLLAQEREHPGVGDSMAQTEQFVRDLDTLDAEAQHEMSRAQILILQGHQLAASHHYALALICQRCNELRHLCDVLTAALRAKRESLGRAQDLLSRLEQAEIGRVHDKLGAMRGTIQNRQTSLRKLADKQVRPIQLVAPRPETPTRSKSPLFSPKHGVDFNSSLKFSFDLSLPGKKMSRKSPNSRKIEVMHDYQENLSSISFSLEGEDSPDLLKRHVMKELIETERVYVDELLSVLLGYRAEMENPVLYPLLPPILRDKKEVLFGNMPEIYSFHSRLFLQDLESCLDTPESVGACFLGRKENFQVYEQYCQNKPRSESLWRQCSDCAFFQECQKKLDHKLGLDSYLLKPVQRLTKYQLLLKELLKYSVGCEGASELQGALEAMLDLLKSVNDSMHQIAITGYEGDLSDLGRVLMQGSFSVWISHRKGPTKMKDLARFKPMQRHLFLHERALLFCKRREEHGEGYDKTHSYSFKHCLKMSAVGITENVKGDIKKFEIWYSGREEVYVVQAPSVEVKLAWLSEIRKILTNQQKLTRDDSLQPSPASDHIQLSPPLFDSKLQRASFSSEENESGRTSPVLMDSLLFSPQPQHSRRSWHGTSHSVDICEGLEDWTGPNELSNPSDSEEEEEIQLCAGRYRAQADLRQRSPDDLVIRSGDTIQLLQEDSEGLWWVRSLSRRQEGRVSAGSLQQVLGESRVLSGRLGDPGNLKTRKLSSP
ncbi:proto-oncogene DBL isoform X2 [Lepisosteus oculatus]|uniref:proto-oncogene DBL isoform X2 n=1 Tax=Lepisosteus oculatus TaxID=7918 RepID=UPI003714F589